MKCAGGVALFGTEPKRMSLARLFDRMLQIDVLVHRKRPFWQEEDRPAQGRHEEHNQWGRGGQRCFGRRLKLL